MRRAAARRPDLLAVLAAGAVLLAGLLYCAAAAAQSQTRGASLYTGLGCDTGNCHGTNPLENLNNVLNGAGSPAAIEYASVTRTEMHHLYATLISDQTVAQDIAAWLSAAVKTAPPPPPVPSGPTTTVVEYYHAGFGHYFVTGIAGEIAALDSGQVAGWSRTGKSFKAYAGSENGLVAVCRFFTVAFPPRSSHFYTPVASECSGLRSNSKEWQYEGDAFFVALADAAAACPAGTQPVYRLYNNGQSGAPNHRYTNDNDVRTAMIANGWATEGFGAQGVAFCAPT